jgi:hypothetical protein
MTREWEQRSGESEAAFAAFRVFRDAGPGREVVAAYRQAKSKPQAKQASGTWNAWAIQNSWIERARAYDQFLEAEHLRGAARAARDRGRVWALRAESQRDRTWAISQRLMRKADKLSRFPVARRESRDGGKVVLEPLDPRALRVAALVAKDAHLLAMSAVGGGAAHPTVAEVPEDPSEAEALRDQAARQLHTWVQEMFRTEREFYQAFGKPPAISKPTDPPEPDPSPATPDQPVDVGADLNPAVVNRPASRRHPLLRRR